MCVRGGFLEGGERMAVVSGWLVPLENSLLLPSFLPSPDRGAAPVIRAEVAGVKSSDAAKRYSEQRRTSNCNAAHFYSLLNCAGGRMERRGGGRADS